MLSVLIPVYNFDVRAYARHLSHQASELSYPIEIFFLDDASAQGYKEVNREVSNLPNCRYEELPANLGRAVIRNRMAEKANGDFLLFTDCDSMPENELFLKTYINLLPFNGVICGGRTYQKETPEDKLYLLHWKYGSEREMIPSIKRQVHGYRSFMTNNFLIPKSLFLSIQLDEKISGYGHEDTVFGAELKKKKVFIHHIDNPLRHIGLENKQDFLAKSEEAVRNLHELVKRGKDVSDIKLAYYYKLVCLLRLKIPLKRRFIRKKDAWKANLYSDQPSLRKFDLYRLHYMCTL